LATYQLTANRYTNSDQLPPGRVLVVGSGASGYQIADDLLQSGGTYACPLAVTGGFLAAIAARISDGGRTRWDWESGLRRASPGAYSPPF
jgi:cation diffusion facilitator CzcD-associated flavoprotein CzcO